MTSKQLRTNDLKSIILARSKTSLKSRIFKSTLFLDSLKPEYIEGMTLLGGEPFEEENQEALLPFMKKVKSLYPDKNVWAFTGYIYDKDLILGGRKHTKDTDDLLSLIDVLVDGPFIEEQKDITLKFRGSVNQRILDLKKTMESGKIVKLME